MTKTEKTYAISVIILAGLMTSCSIQRRVDRATDRSGYVRIRQTTDSDKAHHAQATASTPYRVGDTGYLTESVTDKDGEEIPSVTLGEVEVVARTRVVTVRNGMVSMPFIVTVPKDYCDHDCRVSVFPVAHTDTKDKELDPLVVTGKTFRKTEERDMSLKRRSLRHEERTALLEHVRDASFLPYKYRDSLEVKRTREITKEWEAGADRGGWRTDTVIHRHDFLIYYYRQEIPAEEIQKKISVTYSVRYEDLQGGNVTIPGKDTIQYVVTTMADMLDRAPRYTVAGQDTVRDSDYDEALRLMDEHQYKKAFAKLTERRDMNAAVCYLSMGYNARAVNILVEEPDGARRNYLLAIGYLRLDMKENATAALLAACRQDHALAGKAEMDPELSSLVREKNLEKELYNE